VALRAYNDSLRVCFQVGLIMACLSILGAISMKWSSVKKNLPPKNHDDERVAEEGNGQGDLSGTEAPEAEALAVFPTDREKNTDRYAAAAVLTASQASMARTSMFATWEKKEEKPK
jgi:hypothetical protein